MTISPENRALLERKLRGAPAMTDPAMKIRLTVENIGKLLDEARAEGAATAIAVMKPKRPHRPGSVESILQEMGEIVNGAQR
jgi:hypothetical protein